MISKQNAEMKELKMAFLESQRKVEEFNWKLNEMEGKLKNCVVGKQRKSVKMDTLGIHNNLAINFCSLKVRHGNNMFLQSREFSFPAIFVENFIFLAQSSLIPNSEKRQ
jgi:hypothetical protein